MGANLMRADLTEADLHAALLGESHLMNAKLHKATLRRAYLSGAKLHGAHLGEAYIERKGGAPNDLSTERPMAIRKNHRDIESPVDLHRLAAEWQATASSLPSSW